MTKARFNAIVDIALFPILLLSIFSGVIAWKVLPSGSEGGGGRGVGHELFLGLVRGEWRSLHAYASLVLAGLVLLHLALHWRWILCIPRMFARLPDAETCTAEVVDPQQDRGPENS